MKKEVTTFDDKILAAADKCPEAKKVLEILFPEVFEDDKDFKLDELINPEADHPSLFTDETARKAGFDSAGFMQIRNYGEYKNKAFWLDDNYNWRLKNTEGDEYLLIPTKK